MFRLKPQGRRKQTFNKTTNVLTSNMVTNQSKPYQQLKDDIEELQKNISSLEKVNSNIAENLGSISDKVTNLDYSIDKIFTGNIDVVFFMPEGEISSMYEILYSALNYGTNYNVNIVNDNDIGVTSDNIVEKFINYYTKGYRYFISWNYSSIISVINNFFNNISTTHPNINLDEILFLETASTCSQSTW
jgi:phage-related tail protein